MVKNYSLAVYDYQDKKLCDLANENIFIKGEAYNINLHWEINGYKELNFNLPAKIEDENGNIIDNFRLDFIKNEYKSKLKIDDKIHDFIIKKVQRQRDSKGAIFYSVKCVCAAFDKLSKSGLDLYFEDEVGNAQTLLAKVLEGSDWSVGIVDTFMQDGYEKYRTLSGEKTNRYSLIQEICNLFECYPVFHTDTKKVDLRSEIGVDRGVQFRYSKNLKEIVQNIDSDEIITKLWVEGGEHPDHGLTLISSHNPTGENYILNFQYYIDLGLLTSEQIAAINQFQSDITNINNAINTLLNDIASLSLDKTLKESEKEGKEIEKIAKQQAIEELNKKIAIEKNATIKQELMNQRDTLQTEVNTLTTEINNLINDISSLDSQITTKESELSTQLNNKNTAITNLEQAVGDFIREGIYQNTNYIDAEALYKDALKVSERLAYPRVSYEVNVLDLSRLTGYEIEKFGLGDIVYIIDETLNINTNGRITTIDYVLDNPKDTRITISNYDTKFEDLFKKIITATNIINSHKEMYDRVKGINADGTLNYDLLQKTFDNNTFQVKFGTNNNVITDKYGITIKDNNDPNKIVRINAGGIFITSDGGQTWKYALSADGISALSIVSGMIDTKVLQIWNSDKPAFHWDADGLTAVDTNNPNKWIRFNENGIFYTQDGGQTYQAALTFDGLVIRVGSHTIFEEGYDPSTKETPTGAQAKANAAEQSAKAYTDTQFTVLDGKIATKVSQTEFDALEGRVSSAESTLTQHANEIALRVRKDELGSEIVQNAASVKIAVGQIGGTNLIKNGNFAFGKANWEFTEWRNPGNVVFEVWDNNPDWCLKDDNNKTAVLHCIGADGIEVGGGIRQFIPIKPGRTYTFQCLLGVHRATATIEIWYDDANKNRILRYITEYYGVIGNPVLEGGSFEDDYTKYIAKCTDIPSSARYIEIYIYMYYNQHDGYVFLDNIKLEEGENVTAWSPHPSELRGTTYIFDGDSFKIGGSANDRIEISPTYIQAYKSGVKRVHLDYDSLDFYDTDSRLTAHIYAIPEVLADYFTLPLLEIYSYGGMRIYAQQDSNNYAEINVWKPYASEYDSAPGIVSIYTTNNNPAYGGMTGYGVLEVSPGGIKCDARQVNIFTDVNIYKGYYGNGDLRVDGWVYVKGGTRRVVSSLDSYACPTIASTSKYSVSGAWVTWDYPDFASTPIVIHRDDNNLGTRVRNATATSCEVCMAGTASGYVRVIAVGGV